MNSKDHGKHAQDTYIAGSLGGTSEEADETTKRADKEGLKKTGRVTADEDGGGGRVGELDKRQSRGDKE